MFGLFQTSCGIHHGLYNIGDMCMNVYVYGANFLPHIFRGKLKQCGALAMASHPMLYHVYYGVLYYYYVPNSGNNYFQSILIGERNAMYQAKISAYFKNFQLTLMLLRWVDNIFRHLFSLAFFFFFLLLCLWFLNVVSSRECFLFYSKIYSNVGMHTNV